MLQCVYGLNDGIVVKMIWYCVHITISPTISNMTCYVYNYYSSRNDVYRLHVLSRAIRLAVYQDQHTGEMTDQNPYCQFESYILH